jgi:hypothetical protein
MNDLTKISSTAIAATPIRGLLGEFFVLPKAVKDLRNIDFDATPKAVGAVGSLNHMKTDVGFFKSVPADHFAARYTGDLNISKAGKYTFFLSADNDAALFIDGKRVILTNADNKLTEGKVTLTLKSGAHDIEIRYFENTGKQSLKLEWQGPDSGGARSVVQGKALTHTPEPAEPAPPAPESAPAGKLGLDVSYFQLTKKVSSLDQVDFMGTAVATGTASALNHMNTNAAFWKDGLTDAFAARYTGDLNISKAGKYTFFLSADNDAALFIDGKRVILTNADNKVTEGKVTLTLTSGAHDIEVRYFENSGRQSLKLEWQGPDSAGVRGVITGKALTHSDEAVAQHAGLLVDYFILPKRVSRIDQVDFTAKPAKELGVTEINHLRTTAAFWEGGATDLFAARYEGNLNVVNAGKYTLYLTADEGAALFLDGKQLIASAGAHGTREYKVTVDLAAGAHDLEIRYFENAGQQSLKFEWKGPDSDGLREVVSGTSLSHDGPIHAGDPGPCPDDGGAVCQCGSGTDDNGTDTGTDTGGGTGTTDPGHDHGTDTGTDTGTGTGTDTGGHDHEIEVPLPLPNTAAEADAYVAAVKAQPNPHFAHDDDPKMIAEHGKLLDLVPRAEATHVAIANGDWFDPDTWYEGRIPGADAKVLIPAGVSVTYDGESDVSLFTVRVDGELSFATDRNTKMIVDTMIITGTGRLEIGSEDNPVGAGVTTKILIANNGDIDVSWDPMLLSRGIVSQGQVDIHGAEKTSFLKVSDAPMKGDTVIKLAEVPEGWRVGDTVIISGTHKQGFTWVNGDRTFVESQDEEVRITKIEGGAITIDRPLVYDHDTPRADLFAYVANMTRNITISSEDGEATALNARGHVMFMHSDDVDVRYAAFDDLGRTDKSEPAFDVGTLTTVEADSNIKGRYPLHFHKTGTTDQDDPAIAIGNTISGSPGWGFVQHSSNANFIDNIAFDIFGAAFAAEDGDETGIWQHNMAIKTEGIGPGIQNVKGMAGEGDTPGDWIRHDNGRTGDGFFFAGRLVEAADNVAVNTTFGFVWMTRSAPADPLAQNLDTPEIAYGKTTFNGSDAPIQGFLNNEAFGTQYGLVVIKANPSSGHDVRSVLEGFLNWETSNGVQLGYSAHYTLKDFDLIGTDNTGRISEVGTAVTFGTNAFDIVFNGLKIEGFKIGVDFQQKFTADVGDGRVGHILIDVSISDTSTNYEGLDPKLHKIMTSADLTPDRLVFKMTGDTTLSLSESLLFDGIKTDSIGSTERQYAFGEQKVSAASIRELLKSEGYFNTADGKKVMLIEDFVADRATGELYKLSHVITLEATQTQLDKLGAINNGLIKLGGLAPVVGDDAARVEAGHDILLDVLRNDRDPEGALIEVDGFTDARHGEVFQQENGQLLYRPNEGFTGTDTFSYWAADDAGHFSKATVTIDVWDL